MLKSGITVSYISVMCYRHVLVTLNSIASLSQKQMRLEGIIKELHHN